MIVPECFFFFFFGEEACAGNGWGNIIKSQSSALLG